MDFEKLVLSPLFMGLAEAEIKGLVSACFYKIRKFRPGSIIAHGGDTVENLMFVTAGVVKGEMTDYAGRVIKIEDIPAPRAIAPAFIFGSRNRYPVDVIAVSDAELLVISKKDFLGMMMKNSVVLLNFLNMISDRSQFLSGKIRFLNFKTIKGKLAHMIIQNAGSGKDVVNLNMTQSDLAEFFGVARPSVARALGELEDAGYIKTERKDIRILDRAGLIALTAG